MIESEDIENNKKSDLMITKGNEWGKKMDDISSSLSGHSCSPDASLCVRSHFFPLFLLLLLLFVVYFNSFNGTWIFDDYPNIVDNDYVHLTSLDWQSIKGTFKGIQGNKISRPLSYLSFGVNYYFHGLDVLGYHLVNFIMHCLTALFLYLFVFNVLHLPIIKGRFTGQEGSIALLSATLWAINPIQVTAVTVIVQRMASMAGMFFIMTMFFYLKGRITQATGKKIKWFFLCLLSGLLSLSSKENAAMLPIVLYTFDLLLIQGLSREKLKHHLIMAGFTLGIILVLAFIVSNPLTYLSESAYNHRNFTLMERLLTQPRVLLFYLSLMIYPIASRFTLIYDIPLSTSLFSPWTTMPAIIFWMIWTGLGIYFARKRPLISLCMLFFIINHMVESSFIPLELVYEHRNYIPSMMLFTLAGIGIITFIRKVRKKRMLSFSASLLVCFIITAQGHTVIQRNWYFEHALYLWSDNAEKYPELSRVHTNLGLAYEKVGMIEEAKKSYQASIKANRYSRNDLRAVPLNNLGNYYVRNGDTAHAIDLYKQALSFDSSYLPARQGMAVALIIAGDLKQARLLLEETFALGQVNSIFLELYSLVLLKQGDYVNAIKEARKALNTKDVSLIAHKVLGEAYTRLGKYDRANRYWQMCTKQNPDDPEAFLALAHLAYIRGDEETIRHSARKIMCLKGEMNWKEFAYYTKNKQIKDSYISPIFSEDPENVLVKVRHTLDQELKEE